MSLSYALLAMPLAIIGLPLYIYLPTFYATTLEVNIALVGVIIFIARLTDVITDPFIGIISDKSLKKFGSRKPVMFLGFIILFISFYFLINPLKEYAILFLSIFSITIYLGWSMVTIPYLTWSSELSDNYYEKSKLNSTREMFTIFGLILALIVPVFVKSDELTDKLNTLFLLFICLFIPLFIFTILKIKPLTKKLYENFSFEDIRSFYKNNKELKYLQIGYFLNNLANAIPATLFLIFMNTVLKEKDSNEWILIIYFFAGLMALPFWTLLSKKTTKKNIWLYSILLACISFIFVIFLKEGDLKAFALISFVSGLSLGADIAFPTSIQSDVVQREKEKNISGVMFGIWTMVTKLSLAISVVITFGILGLVNFDENNPTELNILVVTLLYALLPIILKIFATFFILKFKE